MTNEKEESKVMDLTGDPVYDYLKSWVLPGNEVLGGRIIENKIVRPKEPRKVITIFVKVGKGQVVPTSYNYLKLARDLKSGKRGLKCGL